MNKSNRETLAALFGRPTPKTLKKDRVESLLLALGFVVHEGRGSRVKYVKDGKVLSMHRPHGKHLKVYQVKQVRQFLQERGITP